MAATVFRPPITPRPPVPTAFAHPRGPVSRFARRFANSTFTTSARGPDCSSIDAFQKCSSAGDYGSCLSTAEAASCNCSNGIQYLDCVDAAIAASTCAGAAGIADWDAYERSWFQTACPTPPSSVMTMLPQPTSVQLDLITVATVIPSGPISEPPRPPATSTFQPGGELLAGECSSTSYTLLHAKDLVLYAAVVGCHAGRPQCCPWNVTTEAAPDTPGGSEPGAFPVPASPKDAALARCPRDYYPVSGQCCPNGYYKFTRELARQTPCFSSLARAAAPPPVTMTAAATAAASPSRSALPTSALINLALAMAFNLSEPAPRLSTGAAVGIGVGSGVAAVVVVAVVVFFVVRWRRRRKEGVREFRRPQVGVGPGEGGDLQGVAYRSGYHAPGEGLLAPAQVKAGRGGGAGGEAWEGGVTYGSGYRAVPGQHQLGGHGGYW